MVKQTIQLIRGLLDPAIYSPLSGRMVKCGIHFHEIEIMSDVAELVDTARHRLGIERAIPVRVLPSWGAHMDLMLPALHGFGAHTALVTQQPCRRMSIIAILAILRSM